MDFSCSAIFLKDLTEFNVVVKIRGKVKDMISQNHGLKMNGQIWPSSRKTEKTPLHIHLSIIFCIENKTTFHLGVWHHGTVRETRIIIEYDVIEYYGIKFCLKVQILPEVSIRKMAIVNDLGGLIVTINLSITCIKLTMLMSVCRIFQFHNGGTTF